MRTIRTVDPQSGITTVREITLISTAGVTFNEYEELPEKNQDVPNMASQLTEAIYDTRRAINESNIINYQMMRDLSNEITSLSEAQTKSQLEAAQKMNEARTVMTNASIDADNENRRLEHLMLQKLIDEVKTLGDKSEINNLLLTDTIDTTVSEAANVSVKTMDINSRRQSEKLSDNTKAIQNVADNVEVFKAQSKADMNVAHVDMGELNESVKDMNEIKPADRMTVTLSGTTMSVNQAFTEIFSLLNGIKAKLDEMTTDTDDDS